MAAERFSLLPRPLEFDDPVIAGVALTPAECRVLAYVRGGFSNKEIAARLNRAESTIKHHVSSVMRKVGVASRMRLMAVLR